MHYRVQTGKRQHHFDLDRDLDSLDSDSDGTIDAVLTGMSIGAKGDATTVALFSASS